MKLQLSVAILFCLIVVACNNQEPTTEKPATTNRTVNTTNTSEEYRPTLTEEEKVNYTALGIDVEHNIPIGLPVGATAPVFKQKDQNGEELFLPKLCKEGPVVLMFYRGQWCPVCDKYLSGVQDSMAMINKTGATVLIITPETQANIAKTIDHTSIDAHIISDNSSLLMKAYKVDFQVTEEYQNKIREKLSTDIAQNNGAKLAQLPVPATYIINDQGKVVWRQFDVDYHNRASVSDILQALSNN